jgi:hypothetical protein
LNACANAVACGHRHSSRCDQVLAVIRYQRSRMTRARVAHDWNRDPRLELRLLPAGPCNSAQRRVVPARKGNIPDSGGETSR